MSEVDRNIYWSAPVRTARRMPTAVLLAVLIVSLTLMAGFGSEPVRVFSAVSAGFFLLLLLEVFLPHRMDVLADGVKFRSGVTRQSVWWRDVEGVALRESTWFGVRTAEIVFTRRGEDDWVVPHFRLIVPSSKSRVGAGELVERLEFFQSDWVRRER